MEDMFTVNSTNSESTVFVAVNGAVEEDDFINLLPELISQLKKQEGKKDVLLKLSHEQSNLVKYAAKEGFGHVGLFGDVTMQLYLRDDNHNPQPDASHIMEGFRLCDGSLGTHKLLYAIPHTNHNPQPNVSHAVGIKQGDDSIAAANKRKGNEFELSDMKSVALRSARIMRLPKDPIVSDNRALYMLPAKDNTGLVLYAVVIWVTGVFLQTFYQAAGPTLQNKIMLEASCGSLFGNMVVATLVFAYGRDKPKNKGFSFVFNLTLAIPLYLGYSMLMPGWYSWIGFPVICIILTIAEFHEKIRKMFQVIF